MHQRLHQQTPKATETGGGCRCGGGGETLAEVNPEPVETDFAAALKMLALLPLSDEERAEAVRRLLRGCGGVG